MLAKIFITVLQFVTMFYLTVVLLRFARLRASLTSSASVRLASRRSASATRSARSTAPLGFKSSPTTSAARRLMWMSSAL